MLEVQLADLVEVLRDAGTEGIVLADLHQEDVLDLLFGLLLDEEVDAPALQGSGQLPVAVGGENHDGEILRQAADSAEFGYRHGEVGEGLQQGVFDLLGGLVDLVDEQHLAPGHGEGFVDGTLQQELLGEELHVLGHVVHALGDGHVLHGEIELVPDGGDHQQLTLVVVVVEDGVGADALIALQADQGDVQALGQGHRQAGLAHAGVALHQQRQTGLHGTQEGVPDLLVGEVARLLETADQFRNVHGLLLLV